MKPDNYNMPLPIVEIFQSIEGEGTKAGFLTTFIRLFGCNLKCSWCDTKYSYGPYQPNLTLTVAEIINRVTQYQNPNICLTGGEPLLHGEKSVSLIKSLSRLDFIKDIHIETNGSIDLGPLAQLRGQDQLMNRKVRFIMDYKLPSSGETMKMLVCNFHRLLDQDEIKFVIACDQDFYAAIDALTSWHLKGQPLFSPVWESMPLERLANMLIESGIKNAKLNIQLQKLIWGGRQGV
ncbi:MAG: radical SAM protein [Firmicutes bacterium]|nr:radical SAM protein [Bacillota bacterium]